MQAALLELGRYLQREGYEFITVTPETHRRVNRRAVASGDRLARSLRDVFGWNRPFRAEILPRPLLEQLETAELLVHEEDAYRAHVRFSTLGGQLFAHSGFPTVERDAVFFGPDTYRFCAALRAAEPRARRLVDVGAGSGAGGLSLARYAEAIVLTDVNSKALQFAEVNAALAGVRVSVLESDVLASVDGPMDLVIANPPYLKDEASRVYRDGGGRYGEALAVRIAREACERLSRGGRLLLYTGAPIVDGRDLFLDAVRPILDGATAVFTYRELDPDVFGEELKLAQYHDVERFAAVLLDATLTSP